MQKWPCQRVQRRIIRRPHSQQTNQKLDRHRRTCSSWPNLQKPAITLRPSNKMSTNGSKITNFVWVGTKSPIFWREIVNDDETPNTNIIEYELGRCWYRNSIQKTKRMHEETILSYAFHYLGCYGSDCLTCTHHKVNHPNQSCHSDPTSSIQLCYPFCCRYRLLHSFAGRPRRPSLANKSLLIDIS